MYFPYLRGKQYELALLKELSPYLAESGKVVPIIEPVNESLSNINSAVKILNRNQAPYGLVINPSVGDRRGRTIDPEREDLVPHEGAFLVMIINRDTVADSVIDFLDNGPACKRLLLHCAESDDIAAILRASRQLPNQIVHAFGEGDVSQHYINSFQGLNKVMVRDAFRRADRNADYRGRDREFFSDAHLTFVNDGLFGFGDYAMIGKAFMRGGFSPRTVAIHSTYRHPANNSLRIRHFLSDRFPNTTADVDGKVQESLVKMRGHLEEMPCDCDGCTALMAMQRGELNPHLGLIKKLSIHHHLKMVGALI